MAIETYNIEADFTGSGDPGDRKCDVESFHKAVADDTAVGAVGDLVGVTSDETDVTVEFTSARDAGQKTALTALVAAHTGIPATKAKFHASSKLVMSETEITAVGSWQVLGRTITTPGFFTSNPSAFGNVVVLLKSVGVGAQLRLVEDDIFDGSGDVVVATPYDIGDTSGAYSDADFKTTVALRMATRNEYRLEGRLDDGTNTATSAHVKVAEVALLEPIT